MSEAVTEHAVMQTLDAIYEAALSPTAWPVVLERLAGLFRSHFADVFSRTHDRSQFSGLAFGLDDEDYQEQFLETWFKRNVWGLSRPVRDPGEVLSTREMVGADALMRSPIYNEYLAPRDLHEGLRLSIWADAGGIQDISLLRSWSAGAFDHAEIELGHTLLPHLQRVAAIAKRLHHAEAATEAGQMALDAAGFAMILLDARGAPILLNRSAERIVREKDGLTLNGTELCGGTADATHRLRRAIGRGIDENTLVRAASSVRLPRPAGGPALTMIAVPLRRQADISTFRRPALLLLMNDPNASGPTVSQLVTLFGLTDAEADLAAQLLAGHDMHDIAARRGRSVHTVRNHLAHLMGKTDTTRQSDLARLLRGIPSESVGAS